MSKSPLAPVRRRSLATRTALVLLLIAGLTSFGTGCSESTDGSTSSTQASSTNADSDSSGSIQPASNTTDASGRKPVKKPASKSDAETAPRHPNERPLPNFEGPSLSGTRIRVSDMLGARLVLFIFNPEVDAAVGVAEGVARIAKLGADENFKVLGVGVGSSTSKLTRFVDENGLAFPIIDDSRGSISQKLRLRTPMAVMGVDPEGYMSFGIANFALEGDVAGNVETELRKRLRLAANDDSVAGALISYPKAPALGVTSMSGGNKLEIADLSGRAAIVIFFLHTCPHCHKALAAIEKIQAGINEAQRPRLVAISLTHDPSAVRRAMKELDLDYFDPYLDPGQLATDRWGVTGGVPAIFVLDGQGRIRHSSSGWNEKRDAGMLRMQVSRAAGVQVPMLLDAKGFSGSEVCGACHEQEFATWQYTKHATAFSTLVKHGAERRTDCVGCHVVGFEKTGGYNFERRPPHLEDVGCESCHGRGGPHLSPDFLPPQAEVQSSIAHAEYEAVCTTCHNPTHSLGFDFEKFNPRVSHAAIAALSNAERAELLDGAGPERNLLPTRADYVGSNACQSCHAAEFKTWEASPHGHSIASLEKKGKQNDPECLACHTTAFGKTGGFAEGDSISAGSDLARVGCESCHGPGSAHIDPEAKRVGTILSLGDKCDSCVILKVCGSCHDKANDPRFEFEVEKRIDDQRHGTVPSAATRAGESAAHFAPHPLPVAYGGDLRPRPSQTQHDRALLEFAFEQLEVPPVTREAPQPSTPDPLAVDPS